MQDNLAKTAQISALKIIKEHEKIAFSNFANLKEGWMKLKDFQSLTDEEKSSIAEIQTRQLKRDDGVGEVVLEEWVKVKLYDKQKSLDSISKLLGFDAPQKVDITTKGDAVKQITYIKWGDKEIPV